MEDYNQVGHYQLLCADARPMLLVLRQIFVIYKGCQKDHKAGFVKFLHSLAVVYFHHYFLHKNAIIKKCKEH